VGGGVLRHAAGCEPKQRAASACSQRLRLKEFQNEIVGELERLGATPVLVHYVLTDLLAHKLTFSQIAQRVRAARERRERHAIQRAEKPELRKRCIAAYEAQCAYCDRTGTPERDPDGKSWELDRIFPGKFGGEYEPLNVALACHACNRKKGCNVTFLPPPSLAQREDGAAPPANGRGSGHERRSAAEECEDRTRHAAGITR
jgi:5-methylcytosine-specific restriction endonuclease McrA